MAAKAGFQKIVWSVDAFVDDPKLNTRIVDYLRVLSLRLAASVEPVFVLSPAQMSVETEFTQEFLSHYKDNAYRRLEKYLQSTKIKGLLPPVVLVQNTLSTRSSVDSVVQYAKDKGADLVAVSTHARKGLSRVVFGSFAETLIHHCRKPVFSVNPGVKSPHDFKTVVFSTDFSQTSAKAFESFLPVAAAMKSNVILFHKILYPIEPVLQSGVYTLGGGWISISKYLDSYSEAKQKIADQWIAKAQPTGAKVETIIETSGEDVVKSLMKVVKRRKVSCVVMLSQTGPVTAAFMGSITKKVMRDAPCPVWVLHP